MAILKCHLLGWLNLEKVAGTCVSEIWEDGFLGLGLGDAIPDGTRFMIT